MGVFWSHGINCDKKLLKTLIDNETWFDATLIEYSASSASILNKVDWNFTLPRSSASSKKVNIKSSNNGNVINLLNKTRKCFGRITVQDDCIIFQGINCNELLKVIGGCQDKSPTSVDSNFSEVDDNSVPYNQNINHSASSASTTSGGNENDIAPRDRLRTFVWPIETVRHFGFKENFFSFESGRYSSTGEGRFTFKIKKLVLFLSNFQNVKESLYHSKPKTKANGKHQELCKLSAEYYNLIPPDSYQISRSALTGDLEKMKSNSQSTEIFFNSYNSASPATERSYRNLSSSINYCKIDFTDNNFNAPSNPNGRRRVKSNGMLSKTGESIHYLTICENQTKAVEKVLQRIG